ncbi:MAG: PD40 domain-containing protein [Holosporaceae bacterium]|nr:MAG: PD40 domain-containing protein [Holosporaceae bacterium]
MNDLRSSGFVQVVTKDAYVEEEPSFCRYLNSKVGVLSIVRAFLLAKVSVEGSTLPFSLNCGMFMAGHANLILRLRHSPKIGVVWPTLWPIKYMHLLLAIQDILIRVLFIFLKQVSRKKKKALGTDGPRWGQSSVLNGGAYARDHASVFTCRAKNCLCILRRGAAKAKVHIWDFEKDTHDMLSDLPGITYAPRFSPDGQTIVMSQARNGNSHIYAVDLKYKKPRQLTKGLSIDTSPSFSPDGKKRLFSIQIVGATTALHHGCRW